MVDPRFETAIEVPGFGTVQFRCVRGEDTDRLYTLFQGLGPQTRAWFRPHAPWTRDVAQSLTAQADDPNALRFLAMMRKAGREEPAGYGFLIALQSAQPILGIVVADAYQGKGLGTVIMRHLISVAQQLGKRAIHLTVDDDNLRARHVYENMGFTTVRIIHHMELPLGQSAEERLA